MSFHIFLVACGSKSEGKEGTERLVSGGTAPRELATNPSPLGIIVTSACRGHKAACLARPGSFLPALRLSCELQRDYRHGTARAQSVDDGADIGSFMLFTALTE